jgi:hypothetical protein
MECDIMLFFLGVAVGFILTFLIFKNAFSDALGEFKLCNNCSYKQGFIKNKVTNIEEVSEYDRGFNGNSDND